MLLSRTPPGVRGLKRIMVDTGDHPRSRTPPGVRGLKQIPASVDETMLMSHPTRGAWIETEP